MAHSIPSDACSDCKVTQSDFSVLLTILLLGEDMMQTYTQTQSIDPTLFSAQFITVFMQVGRLEITDCTNSPHCFAINREGKSLLSDDMCVIVIQQEILTLCEALIH